MAEKLPIFTVDLEDWNHALHTVKGGHSSVESVYFLLDLLEKYNVKAIFYVLGRFRNEFPNVLDAIEAKGHILGDHGYYHDHGERQVYAFPKLLYRSPYWDTTPMPTPPSGGFFFRVLPLAYVLWAVRRSGTFWIHPHDLDEGHPKIDNPLMNWKRHVGLKGSRAKLDKLLSDITWGDPNG